MSRRTSFTGTAAGRRRERRANLQTSAASSAEVMHKPTPSRAVLTLKRTVKRTDATAAPVQLNTLAKTAFSIVRDYKLQIVRASYLYQHEFKRKPLVEGATCLPEVAIYRAGHRKSDNITAR